MFYSFPYVNLKLKEDVAVYKWNPISCKATKYISISLLYCHKQTEERVITMEHSQQFVRNNDVILAEILFVEKEMLERYAFSVPLQK